ncbi:hypothetical protein GMJAKD_06200 [Candidatus Electrothrix aarhusensis]
MHFGSAVHTDKAASAKKYTEPPIWSNSCLWKEQGENLKRNYACQGGDKGAHEGRSCYCIYREPEKRDKKRSHKSPSTNPINTTDKTDDQTQKHDFPSGGLIVLPLKGKTQGFAIDPRLADAIPGQGRGGLRFLFFLFGMGCTQEFSTYIE